MTIGKICNRAAVTIQRQASVENAARLMRSHYVGAVIVVDGPESRNPVGILTDRDIAVNVVAQGLAPANTTVASVMSAPVLALRHDEGFISALDQMSARGVRRAPVMNAENRLIGLVSVDDILPLLGRELAKIGALIRHEQAAEVRRAEQLIQDEFAS